MSISADVKFDSRLGEYYVWGSVQLDDPSTCCIVDWLNFWSETPETQILEWGLQLGGGHADLPKHLNYESYSSRCVQEN